MVVLKTAPVFQPSVHTVEGHHDVSHPLLDMLFHLQAASDTSADRPRAARANHLLRQG